MHPPDPGTSGTVCRSSTDSGASSIRSVPVLTEAVSADLACPRGPLTPRRVNGWLSVPTGSWLLSSITGAKDGVRPGTDALDLGKPVVGAHGDPVRCLRDPR